MTVDTQVTWLTQEAYDRLKHELDELIANRPVIAAEINARREEGDLKENGGYHAAREEGSHGDLEVISPNSPLGAALLGAHVGDTREYALPDGGSMKVSLVSAEPYRA